MKLARAWHLLINEDGTRAERGGRPLTVGIDHDGRLWLFTDPIGGGGLLLADDAAEWLSATLTDARTTAAAYPESAPPFATVPRLRHLSDGRTAAGLPGYDPAEAAAWLAGRGRLEGQLEIGDVDQDPEIGDVVMHGEMDAQGGMSWFGSLPVVDDDDDLRE
jgi:hypothetical protein